MKKVCLFKEPENIEDIDIPLSLYVEKYLSSPKI